MITLRLFDHEAQTLLDTVTDAVYAAGYNDTFGDKYTLEDIMVQLDREIEDNYIFGSRAADELSYDPDRYGRYAEFSDYLDDDDMQYGDYGRTATAADVAVLTPRAEADVPADVPAEPDHVTESIPLPEPPPVDEIEERIDRAVKAALWVEREQLVDALQELIERIYQS